MATKPKFTSIPGMNPKFDTSPTPLESGFMTAAKALTGMRERERKKQAAQLERERLTAQVLPAMITRGMVQPAETGSLGIGGQRWRVTQGSGTQLDPLEQAKAKYYGYKSDALKRQLETSLTEEEQNFVSMYMEYRERDIRLGTISAQDAMSEAIKFAKEQTKKEKGKEGKDEGKGKEGDIVVYDKDGNPGHVSISNLKEALDTGFTLENPNK